MPPGSRRKRGDHSSQKVSLKRFIAVALVSTQLQYEYLSVEHFRSRMTASIRDVARRAQVSVGTVSNVLNTPEKVSPETRERVQTVIAQLGYVRNDAARQLRNGQSHTIGLIVLNGTNPFFTEIAQGAQNRALESGYTVLVGTSNENVKRENTLLSLFAEQQVAGILVSPTGDDLSPLCHLKDGKTPVVLVDR